MTDHALRDAIDRFDPHAPIERALTPPASWYLEPAFLDLERTCVFHRTWQPAGRVDQLRQGGDYVAGTLLDVPYVLVRDGTGALRAFHNVCRHHAAEVCHGEGSCAELVCPYHGWTYRLDGNLTRAPGLGRSDVFEREAFSLRPIAASAWGPVAFIHVGDEPLPLSPMLAELTRRLSDRDTAKLRFAARRTYDMRCNWKVYVDNYLDGGYHVAALHKGLAGQLDLSSYTTELFERYSIQSCRAPDAPAQDTGADFAERIGPDALYAFVYPNLMINRYGPILDTNAVIPLTHDTTRVVFDFYFESTQGADARSFIERSIAASHVVQEEDVAICESVQRGLASPSYDQGIYGKVETAAHHFHRLLAADLK